MAHGICLASESFRFRKTCSYNPIASLEKNDPATSFLRWNLTNLYGRRVASSVYTYHDDVPGVGEKVGKLIVLQAK